MNNVGIAFLLTLLAGLSTGIGSCLALLTKKANKRILSISLGFSAGVMIYVSMIEIFSKAKVLLIAELGVKSGNLFTVLAFFIGIFFLVGVNRLMPGQKDEKNESQKLMRMGVYTAIAMAIHNFPEGLATFISALQEPGLAIPIVVAIAIHNIPEGIAVSMPIYQATNSRKKAFFYSLASGLAEPIGAVIGFLLLMPFMSDTLYGLLYAGVAGIMVYLSFNELLPVANQYGSHKLSITGLIGGMILMAISLLLFL